MKTLITRYMVYFTLVTGVLVYMMPWNYIDFTSDQASASPRFTYSYLFQDTPIINGCRTTRIEWISESVELNFKYFVRLRTVAITIHLLIFLLYSIFYRKSVMGLSRLAFVLINVVLFLVARVIQTMRFPFIACDPMPGALITDTSLYVPTLLFSVIGIALGAFSVARLLQEQH